MRPRSEEAQALLQAALKLSKVGRGVTLAEMAAQAQVGKGSARSMVRDFKRYSKLKIVGFRRVSYRNRPVAEYAPVDAAPAAPGPCAPAPWAALAGCVAAWPGEPCHDTHPDNSNNDKTPA